MKDQEFKKKLRKLYDEWQAMEPEYLQTNSNNYVLRKENLLSADLVLAFLDGIADSSCSFCGHEDLILSSLLGKWATTYTDSFNPKTVDDHEVAGPAWWALSNQMLQIVCGNCGHAMYFRQDFVLKRIEQIIGAEDDE